MVTHEDPKKVFVCNYSRAITQSVLEKQVKDFISKPDMEVFLFVASMHGLQKDMKKILNHVRIIIESEEAQVESQQQQQLFVLLIHFPPVMFFSACYPTLFLNGWDHHYLDSLTPGDELKKSINIQDLSLQFCLSSNYDTDSISQIMSVMLSKLLNQAVPMIVSQMTIDNKPGTIFNIEMDGFQRSDLVA